MKKEDKLIPIVPIVVYYGNEEWDGSQDIHGMLEMEGISGQENLREYIPNYKINLIRAANVEHPENYKSSLQQVFGMLKCKSDREAMKKFIKDNKEKLSSVDEDTFRVLESLLGGNKELKKYRKEDAEEMNMCRAFEEMIQEGKLEGKIETLIDFLSVKGKVSEELKKKLSEQENPEVVEKWIKLAARTSSIEEFEKNM